MGDYELLRKIGAGGMAEVWMGRRAALAGASKAVAIKLLARDVLDEAAYRQMFLEEARLSMLLTNSNVVQVFDVGEIDGECFMVMEWVDGLNLSELARKMGREHERHTIVVAAHIVGEVLRGLAYAHGLHHDGSKATIVHRDVSPQNVLVSVSGEVKLADFGVARLASEETSGLHVKGKLRYMAPEQLRGRSREPTVDLYAVGAILHELLEGERFRQTRDEGDLYSMVLSGHYPPLKIEVPPELARLHAGLLEPDPTRRIQSADEALELLHAWPGYRNCSVELGRLVRKWIGVEAPRSGILNSDVIAAARASGQGSSAIATNAETLDAPTRQASGPLGSGPASGPIGSGAVGSGPIGSGPNDASAITAVEEVPHERGGTQTRTFAETPETEATAVITAQPARGSASSMMIVAAVTLALSFGVFGLGFPLGWWGGGNPAPVEVAAADPPGPTPPTQPTIEPKPPRAAEKTEVPVPVEAGETGGGSGTGEVDDSGAGESGDGDGDGSGDGDGDGRTKRDEKDKKDEAKKTPTGPPADVKFVFDSGLSYAEVKVAGKTLSLEPNETISLKPGKYAVKTRAMPEDGWTSSGTLTVKPGEDLLVKIVEIGKFKTSPLE